MDSQDGTQLAFEYVRRWPTVYLAPEKLQRCVANLYIFHEKKETNVFFRGVTVERPVGLIRNQESQVGQEMHRFQNNRPSGHCQAPTKAKAPSDVERYADPCPYGRPRLLSPRTP